MKPYYHSRTILSLLATTALCVPALSAQMTNTNPGTNSFGVTPPSPPPRLMPPGPMATLSMAERAQLKAAHDKAIQQNPSLEQQLKAARKAMDDARKAIHDAMIQVDPSVGPILDKIAPPKPNGAGGPPMLPPPSPGSQTNGVMTNSMGNSVGMAPPIPVGGGFPPGFASLSPSEQQKLEALHAQVRNDPGVVAAHAALLQAATPQDRHAAFDALRKAIHDAMIKADPSIEPVLAKLQPGGGAQPPPTAPPPPPPAQ